MAGKDDLRLWTIQPHGLWERSTTNPAGTLRMDGRRLTFREDFRSQYRWMRNEMHRRIPGYSGGFPVWAWCQKPDMRSTWWGPGGEEVYRIEFEAPAEKVLLSSFNLWEDYCLMNSYLPALGEDEYVFWEELVERTGRNFMRIDDEGFPEDLAKRIRESWGRIFPDRWVEVSEEAFPRSLKGIRPMGLHPGPPGSVDGFALEAQAVVEEVPLRWVRLAEPFTLRQANSSDR